MNILIIIPGFIPSTIIGILRPLAAIQRQGEINLRLRLTNIPIFISNDIEWCDVAVFCRSCEINDLYQLYKLKRQGKKIIYEIDDNFEEMPLTTDSGLYHRNFSRLHVIKRFFSLSDVTRIYSDRMLERSQHYGARPQLIKSYFDKTIIEDLKRPASDGIIRIAYPTERIDDSNFEEKIFSAVRTVLLKYRGKIEFHLWRKSMPRQLTDVKGVVLNKVIRDYEKFIRAFFKVGFDIGLAPGVDIPFFHSKTNNKYREFGGCKIAGIYSNFAPYSNSVTHEYSGLLVGSSSEEWSAAIERLVLDSNLRAKITANAANDVYNNYSFDKSIESWRNCFKRLKDHKSLKPNWISPSEKLPNYAFVSLSHIGKEDRRFEYFKLAVNAVRKATVFQYNAESYLQYTSPGTFAASVLLINRQEQLQILLLLLHHSNSAIIDITGYEDDADIVIRSVLEEVQNISITFLATVEQSKESLLISSTSDYLLISSVNEPPIFQASTLNGYPAAYLELAERHIQFSSNIIGLFPFKSLIEINHTITNLCSRWNRRFKTVWLWVMWRLGFQKF